MHEVILYNNSSNIPEFCSVQNYVVRYQIVFSRRLFSCFHEDKDTFCGCVTDITTHETNNFVSSMLVISEPY